jgi:hypothetical protein
VKRPDIKPSFEVIVSTYATQAAVALGQMQNPVTKKTEVDLPQAKFAIDLLQILDEKTKGSLTEEEGKFLEDCLYQLRMVYISKSK